MNPNDIVLVVGYGQITRQQAQDSYIQRLGISGDFTKAGKDLPTGYFELTEAFRKAAIGPAYKPSVQSLGFQVY